MALAWLSVAVVLDVTRGADAGRTHDLTNPTRSASESMGAATRRGDSSGLRAPPLVTGLGFRALQEAAGSPGGAALPFLAALEDGNVT